MALSRREFTQLQERVTRLENHLRALEERMRVYDNVLKPENLLRRVRDGEAEERRKAEKEEVFLAQDLPQEGSGPEGTGKEEAAGSREAQEEHAASSAWADLFLPPDLADGPGEETPGS